MLESITIIGLGQVGTSVGLALGRHEDLSLNRIGYDISGPAARHAMQAGAVDQAALDLSAAVATADAVMLALPYDQVLDTVQLIAADLKENTVLLDCAPAPGVLAAKVAALLPPGRQYLGFTPLVGSKTLADVESGYLAADADLLRGGKVAICGPSHTTDQALELAARLAKLLGASPLFAESAEVDGLLAAVHLLPQLSAAALTQAVLGSGIKDRQDFAGRAFGLASLPAESEDTAAALAAAAVENQENVLRALDGLIDILEQQRQLIGEGEAQQLQASLEEAQQARGEWWGQRSRGYTATAETGMVDVQQVRPGFLKQMFGLGGRQREK